MNYPKPPAYAVQSASGMGSKLDATVKTLEDMGVYSVIFVKSNRSRGLG